MSRSGYSDDLSNWELIKYRGQVASALKGKRGQKFLKEFIEELDNMKEKKLLPYEFSRDGTFCSIGLMLDKEKSTHFDNISEALNISECMVNEIMFENDEFDMGEEARFSYMRAWAVSNLKGA